MQKVIEWGKSQFLDEGKTIYAYLCMNSHFLDENLVYIGLFTRQTISEFKIPEILS